MQWVIDEDSGDDIEHLTSNHPPEAFTTASNLFHMEAAHTFVRDAFSEDIFWFWYASFIFKDCT